MEERLQKQSWEDKEDYCEAVDSMRRLSRSISLKYEKAFGELVALLQEENSIKCLENKGVKYAKDEESEKKCCPIRLIILNGDDVTFVCDGRIALSAAEKFLEEIDGKTLEDFNIPISACAGVAIVCFGQ